MKRINRISQGKPPEEQPKQLRKRKTLWEAAENRHASKHSVHSGGTTGGKKQVTFDRELTHESGNERHSQGLKVELRKNSMDVPSNNPPSSFNVARQSEPQLEIAL